MDNFNAAWFFSGLIILAIGVWLIKSRGHGSTAGGLIIGNIGLYAMLVGFPKMGETDRIAIVLTTVLISAIVMIMLPIGAVRIFGAIVAILAFVALSSALVSLPEGSYAKTLLTSFWEAFQTIVRALNPFD